MGQHTCSSCLQVSYVTVVAKASYRLRHTYVPDPEPAKKVSQGKEAAATVCTLRESSGTVLGGRQQCWTGPCGKAALMEQSGPVTSEYVDV